jgi:predicted transcriptional regulator
MTSSQEDLTLGTSPYSIRLDDELRRSLEREAEIEDRPPAQLAVRAIRSMLEAKAAKRAAIDAALAHADQGRFISAEAMNAWIDSWDAGEEIPVPSASTTPDTA